MLMTAPVTGASGYPAAANTVVTADRTALSSPVSDSVSPRAIVDMLSMRECSLDSEGRTAWVSGSPNRQLNSTTLGPTGVSIAPTYNRPVKGAPCALIEASVGSIM